MSSRERDGGPGGDPVARGHEAEPRNLTFGLTDSLGKAIVTGAYDGERFPTEAELAEAHSVSRSVTREAVKMLTAKGLLTARPRNGTTVQPPCPPRRPRRDPGAGRGRRSGRDAGDHRRRDEADRRGRGRGGLIAPHPVVEKRQRMRLR